VQHHSGVLADADIAREVTTTLRAGVIVPHRTIRAPVRARRVTLLGTVPCPHQRDTAEKLVSGLPGVALVVNNVTVAPAVKPSAS
jgi:osmotically-inducible protein OsmY